MKTKIYNKLVRDRIIEITEGKGLKASYRVLNKDEYLIELKKKLLEECKEFNEANSFDNVKEEMADVLEVLYAIAELHDMDLAEVERIRVEKAKTKGVFKKRLFLQTVDEI